MALTVTLLELRTRVYQRGGWEGEKSRLTPAMVDREISLSAMDLRDQMLRAGGAHLFAETAPTISTVDGTTVYAVSGGYYQILNVEVLASAGNPISLTPFMEGDRSYLRNTNVSTAGYPLYYACTGAGSIELLPTPTGVYTITVRRIPAQSPLVSDNSTLDGFNGHEEWIVCDAVRKIASSEKDWPTVQAMDAMCTRLGERVATMARMRDRGGPKRVVDVRFRRRSRI